MPIKIFSFGYWGWGKTADKLKQLVDYSERLNGYTPPFFVDIRIRRSGRATDFIGNNFEKIVGMKRYLWLESLGNESIITGANNIQIMDPGAVRVLLDIAIKKQEDNCRVIFFCSCELPSTCHRNSVTRLLMNYARRQNKKIIVSEWPKNANNNKPIDIMVDKKTFQSLQSGRKSIKCSSKLNEKCIIPWGTKAIVKSSSNGDVMDVYLGYARFQDGDWYWKVLYNGNNLVNDRTINKYLRESGYTEYRS